MADPRTEAVARFIRDNPALKGPWGDDELLTVAENLLAAADGVTPQPPREADHYFVGDRGFANGGNVPAAPAPIAQPDAARLAEALRGVVSPDLGPDFLTKLEKARAALAEYDAAGERSVTTPREAQ